MLIKYEVVFGGLMIYNQLPKDYIERLNHYQYKDYYGTIWRKSIGSLLHRTIEAINCISKNMW